MASVSSRVLNTEKQMKSRGRTGTVKKRREGRERDDAFFMVCRLIILLEPLDLLSLENCFLHLRKMWRKRNQKGSDWTRGQHVRMENFEMSALCRTSSTMPNGGKTQIAGSVLVPLAILWPKKELIFTHGAQNSSLFRVGWEGSLVLLILLGRSQPFCPQL